LRNLQESPSTADPSVFQRFPTLSLVYGPPPQYSLMDVHPLFAAPVDVVAPPQQANGNNVGNNHSAESSPSTSRANSLKVPPSHKCITLWEPIILKQEWTIVNFAKAIDLAAPGVCVRSRAFCDESMPDIHWQLCLYPGGKREENQNNVSLFLKMSSATPREYTVRAEYRFYFIDEGGIARFSNVNVGDFKVKPQKGSHSWGLRNIPKAKVQPCLRQDGSLQIVCQIELLPEVNRLRTLELVAGNGIDSNAVSKSYLSNIDAMRDDESVDCKIICKGQEFEAHKFLLCSHSQVFKAMFKHDTIERQESKINITDTTPKAIEHMLHYLYSSKLSEVFPYEDAADVIQLADKYDMEPLKILVQRRLADQLTISNLCDIFHIAHLHNADQLMESCIPVAVVNSVHLIDSEEFKALKKHYPDVANQLLEKVVTYKGESNRTTNPYTPPNKRLRLNDLNRYSFNGNLNNGHHRFVFQP
jgi:speckle-type POZ protein